jgi:hypothetical protein
VARAYLDQLARTKGIDAARASAVKTALDKVDRIRDRSAKGAAPSFEALTTLAGQIESDAATSTGTDAKRLHALAATLKGRAEPHQ